LLYQYLNPVVVPMHDIWTIPSDGEQKHGNDLDGFSISAMRMDGKARAAIGATEECLSVMIEVLRRGGEVGRCD
jgi:hypothetical protein